MICIVNHGASDEIIGINNRCLDVRNGQDADGVTVQIFDCNGTPSQDWEIDDADSTIRVFQFSKCLDVESGSQDDGAPVQINDCRNTESQVWNLNNAGDIVNTFSNNCLDVRQPAV